MLAGVVILVVIGAVILITRLTYPPLPAQARALLPAAEAYLEGPPTTGRIAKLDGRYICGAHPVGGSVRQKTVKLYLWIECGYFMATRGKVAGSADTAEPAVVTFKRIRGRYRAVRDERTRDSPYYAGDLKRLFPSYARNRINYSQNSNSDAAGKAMLARAKMLLLKRP